MVNLSALERFDDGATVDQAALKEAGLIPNTHLNVKILGNGTLSRRLTVVAGSYSRSAHKAITDNGGIAQNTLGQPFEFGKPVNKRLKRKLDKRLAGLGIESAGGDVSEAPEEEGRGDQVHASAADSASEQGASSPPTGEDAPVTEAPESGQE